MWELQHFAQLPWLLDTAIIGPPNASARIQIGEEPYPRAVHHDVREREEGDRGESQHHELKLLGRPNDVPALFSHFHSFRGSGRGKQALSSHLVGGPEGGGAGPS